MANIQPTSYYSVLKQTATAQNIKVKINPRHILGKDMANLMKPSQSQQPFYEVMLGPWKCDGSVADIIRNEGDSPEPGKI